MRHRWASELGLAICCKSKYEGIFVVVAVFFPCKIKIEREEGACNSEKGHDTEKIWMVVGRMANEIGMASVSCVGGEPKLSGPSCKENMKKGTRSPRFC